MMGPTQCLEYDSDSDSAYPVHHHNKPPFQTRSATMADATQYLEYDSDSENLVTTITSHLSREVKNWLLKYQQLVQFYLTYHHYEVSRKSEMATLADWVLYQRTKFKSDPDNYDSHRLRLLKGIKFSFGKEENNKAMFYTNLEGLQEYNTNPQGPMMIMDGENTGDFKVKDFLNDSPTKQKIILQDFSSVLVTVFSQDFQLK
jgi:hypothetical protein